MPRKLDLLVWSSLAVIISFIALISVNLSNSINEQIEREYATYQMALAESAAKNLQLFFGKVESELELLAKIPAIQSLDVERSYDELFEVTVRQQQLLSSILLVNYAGEIIANPRSPIHPNEFRVQVKNLFQKMLMHGGPILSDEVRYKGEFLGFTLGVPIRKTLNNGSRVTTGMLVALVSQSDLVNNLIAPINIKEGGSAFIMTHARIGLARDSDQRMILNVLKNPYNMEGRKALEADMVAGQKNTIWFKVENPTNLLGKGGRVMITYVPVKFAGVTWSIAIMTPREEITKLVKKSHLQSLALATSMAVILIIGAWVLSRLNRSRAAAEEKAHFATELAEKNIELEKLNKMKDDFVAIVSHDLRSPLGVILGFAKSMLPEAERTGANLKAINSIVRSGERLLLLINDILDLARLQAGEFQLNLTDVEVDTLVHESFRAVQFNADSKNTKLVYEPGDGPTILRADNSKLYQVLNNLIGNAIKFTPENGRITVRKTVSNGNMLIAVSDTGCGLSKDEQKNVFEKFKQFGDSSGGSGLGLAICKNLVELHHGKIWVESAPGDGATFTVSLPLTEETERA